MHPQTEIGKLGGGARVASSGAASGLPLFLVTFLGEALCGALCRWALVYVAALIVGLVVSAEPAPALLAWAAAAAPLIHSVLGLALPGRGFLWRRRLGAREPVEEELAVFEEALNLLQVGPSGPGRPRLVRHG